MTVDLGVTDKDFRHRIKFHWRLKGLAGFTCDFTHFIVKVRKSTALGLKATAIYLIQFSLEVIADITT